MKRCPQCEFIYEDDQSLCDMDGILLVFDSQQLPKPGHHKHTSHGRSRLVTALATLVLATVLYLVYYVSTHQQPAPPTYTPASNIAVQPVTSNPVPPAENVGDNTAPAKEESQPSSVVTEAKPNKEGKVKSAVTPTTKVVKESNEKPKVKSTEKSSDTAPAKQEESKVGSFLKKTGRILKKPFKF